MLFDRAYTHWFWSGGARGANETMERRVGDGSNGNGMQPDVRKGPWTVEEDSVLVNYVAANGGGAWNNLARAAGLNRTGKSCRMRWLNYLDPDVRRGNISPEEEVLIVELHSRWGNRWSKIAKHLPGRTDNEIKNFWRTKIKKKEKSGGSATGHRSKMAVAEDRASTNTSQTTSLQDHSTNVAPPSSELQDHQNCQVTNTIPPEFLAESADNCWGIEGFWTLMQSLI